MRLVAVVDTNVVVAGLLTERDDAPTVKILDGMLAAQFPFALSEALLGEYREVLNRPASRKRHGRAQAELDIVLLQLARNATVLLPKKGPPAPDPGDQHLWDLLASHDALCVVTGDQLLLRQRGVGAAMFSPAEFVGAW